MENSKILNRFWVSFLIICLAVFCRLTPHPPNFAPIAGLSLFSGANLSKKQAFLIPLLSMFISDLILGLHSTMLYVYLSFVFIVFIGFSIKKRQNFYSLIISSFFYSFLFYLITNFGVWVSTEIYPKSINGLIQSYVLAIPFFRNTVLSDFLYTILFFYGYRFALSFFNKFLFIKNRGD